MCPFNKINILRAIAIIADLGYGNGQRIRICLVVTQFRTIYSVSRKLLSL
jgi:hypothetical protein